MHFEEKEVQIKHIDSEDVGYRITTNARIEHLAGSMKKIGLVNSPIMIMKDSAFAIISGFRRIAACRAVGCEKIHARIVSPQTPEAVCAKMAVADNAFQRPLNLIEQSRSVLLLSRFYEDDHALATEADAIGLPGNLSFIKKVRPLCLMPLPIQKGLLSGAISLEMALALDRMPDEIGRLWANLFTKLRPSLNKQREIVKHAEEIAQREDIAIVDVLERADVKKILSSQTLDKGQQLLKLRSYLMQRRFPSVSTQKRRFKAFVEGLKLGNGAKLIASEHFENPGFTLSLYFKNSNELGRHRHTLEKLIHNFNRFADSA